MRVFGVLVVIALAMTAAYGLIQRISDPAEPETAFEDTGRTDGAESITTEPASSEPDGDQRPSLSEFASQCAAQLRERNPTGRLLRINANRLADRCSAIVETTAGSERWLFDWRDAEDGFEHEGELLLPTDWSAQALGTTLTADDYAPARIDALTQATHVEFAEQTTDEWLYEIIYLPAPFSRPITFVTLSDLGPEAEPYDAYTAVFDGERKLEGDEYDQAMALYPMTRFELREDHNFKGALYESTALAEAATSLETDPNAGPPPPLARTAEDCMHWVHKLNLGTRLLRVAWNSKRCHYVLESAQQRGDFYLLTSTGREDYREHPSVQLAADALPNLLLDRSRLTSARVRERLDQALAVGAKPERMAIVWLPIGMVWRFENADGSTTHLNESGAEIPAPAEVPLTPLEQEAGFGGQRVLAWSVER